MRVRATADCFIVSRIYRKGEEFDVLSMDGLPDCLEVISGTPVNMPARVAPAARRSPAARLAELPGQAVPLQAVAQMPPEAKAKLTAMLE